MVAVTTEMGMALDEFIRLYAVEGPFELIDGVRIPKMPNVIGHNETGLAILRALDQFISANDLGEVIYETPFVLSYSSDWVTGSRTPDLMFFTKERIQAYKAFDPDYRRKPYVLVPDLVIEIVSPTDNLAELNDKVNLYLRDGVKLVWVLDPQRKTASASTLTSLHPFTRQQVFLEVTDVLTGGAIIPGFEVALATLFG